MKVLFAVNNEKISESIIKKYQQEYKEIISSKNVYYFNAIAKELQKDKSYDRIIISEDLEPFANNNYEIIDKFIFEKLDDISDEATSENGQDIPIILICADRRTKSDNLLVKIFGIGIYSALLGQDRSITKVCELINMPRTKKDAKIYYKVDSEDAIYKADAEGDVSEIEIQNILNHYRKLGKNEEKYVESFDNIISQYTDAQLRVICKFLPLNVKAVLEANSQKYQELVTFGTDTPNISVKKKTERAKYVPNSDYTKNSKIKKNENKLDIIEKNIGKSNLTKPVIIPSSMSISNVKKKNEEKQINMIDGENTENKMDEKKESAIKEEIENNGEAPKKKRGRPRKTEVQEPKVEVAQEPKKKRGRPRKVQPQENLENSILPGFESKKDENINLFDLGNEEQTGGIILPGFEDEEINEPKKEETKIIKPEPIVEEYTLEKEKAKEDKLDFSDFNINKPNNEKKEVETLENNQVEDIEKLLTKDKKIVAFVGTSKNGTSFLVNNLAELLSRKGIKTAILDLTKNKNAYYIYTQNEEELRKTAYSCIKNLKEGIASGIEVNKNLTVYTTLPGDDYELESYQEILETLSQKYSLVLMDCDFNTDYGYFKSAQEIYLVQTFDILTIQPLTAFLRDLKTKNILTPEKLRVILNKVLRVRSVTERTIIGGMAFYNDPSMSFMTELFNKDAIKYCTIPFETQTYSKYLEGLVNCKISLNGYSKNFITSLGKLSNMVYPLLANNHKKNKKLNSYKSHNI